MKLSRTDCLFIAECLRAQRIGGHPTSIYVESLVKRFEMSAAKRGDP